MATPEIKSAEFTRYSLRSVFFARKLRELGFIKVISEVQNLLEVSEAFDWKERSEWGINDSAWEKLNEHNINPLLYFLHPRIIDEQPTLVIYYRALSLLSQKGFQTISGTSIASLEQGKTVKFTQSRKEKIYTTINKTLSVIIEQITKPDAELMKAMIYAAAGTQIQGAWNNAVGTEGELLIKVMLISGLFNRLLQIVFKNDTSVEISSTTEEALLNNAEHIKILRLEGGFTIVFSQEPDISLRSPENIPLVAAEVKAGTDPAGALERLGAAMKSFENERSLNPDVETIYLSGILTDEVNKRISQTNPFNYTFDFNDIMTDEISKKRFINIFLSKIN